MIPDAKSSEPPAERETGDKQARQFFQPNYSNYPPYHPSYPQWPSYPSFPQFPAVSSSQFEQQQQPDMSWLENPAFTSWLQSVASSAGGASSAVVPSFPSMPSNFPSRPQITIIVINPPAQSAIKPTTDRPIVFETSTQITDPPTTTTTEAPINYSVTINRFESFINNHYKLKIQQISPNSMYNCPRPGSFKHPTNCIQFYRCFEYIPGSLNGNVSRFVFTVLTIFDGALSCRHLVPLPGWLLFFATTRTLH